MASKKKYKCMDCTHCAWLNRWMCDLTCWEFELWNGICSEFEPKEKKDGQGD